MSKFNFKKNNKIKILLILILFLAGTFRFYGLDWDQGQHLHPDERFLTMVLTAIKIPKNFSEYLNPKISPMNPYNVSYSFFVYGTFPLYLTKVMGEIVGFRDYGNIHFVGRILSALFDIGVVFILFKIGQKIFSEKIGLLAAFIYSIMVLPIQLSHFFAVDTFLNFFTVLSFYLLILLLTDYFPLVTAAALGGSFGLALACKISALLFLPIIGLGFLTSLFKTKNIKLFILHSSFFILTTYFFFRFNQPQAFANSNFLNLTPNPQFVKNLKELKSFDNPNTTFPPAIQWLSTKPLIFPLKNLVFWGLGLPLGIICVLGVFFSIIQLINCFVTKKSKGENFPITNYQLLITLWVIFLFIYQGIQFTKPMRYFLPIYPFLALLSAQFLLEISNFLKKKNRFFIFIFPFSFFIFILIYPLSFISIYSKPITRVSASEWIYKNVPEGSTISFEEWDDGLPLGLPNYPPGNYKTESFFMYDPDTPEKWQRLKEKLDKLDYYIITSNRAYGSIMKLPERCPQTIAFYQSLFDGTGQFKKVAEFTSYPCFLPFGNNHWFCFNDDSADESFTVYDHPKVLIFKKYSNEKNHY